LAQTMDFVVNHPSLNRATAGAVDAQDNPGRPLVLKGGIQGCVDFFRARLSVGLNGAMEINHRRVAAIGQFIRTAPVHHIDQDGSEIGKSQKLEENPPAPAGFLLLQMGKG